MKKFIATSPSFDGEISIVYDDNNLLKSVDFLSAELNTEQSLYFFERVPVIYFENTFTQAFGKARLDFIQEGFEVSFTMFWNRYGKKHHMARAKKQWDKLNKVERNKAFFGIAVFFRYLERNTWRDKAAADVYLKDKYWESEWK